MELEYTWNSLGTVTGCSAAVMLITQYVKGYLPEWLPTRLIVLMLAFALLMGAWMFSGGARTWSDVPLIAINSFAVAFAAMGAYDSALKKPG